MKILILIILIAVLIYFFVIAFLYFKKNKEEKVLSEEERNKLLKKNQEEDFIGLLKHLTHQELLFLCLDSDEPICFNFSLEESSDGLLFVFSLNSKKQSINIREEMKKVTFKENGSIVYGQELIKTVREAISNINKKD